MATGECYRNAWRFLKDQQEGTLIHGRVYAGFPERWIDHAWVELPTGYVYEPQSESLMDSKSFYEKSRAEVTDRYTLDEAMRLAGKTRHYGPWGSNPGSGNSLAPGLRVGRALGASAGASIGAFLGGPVGAAIGAVIGAIIGGKAK